MKTKDYIKFDTKTGGSVEFLINKKGSIEVPVKLISKIVWEDEKVEQEPTTDPNINNNWERCQPKIVDTEERSTEGISIEEGRECNCFKVLNKKVEWIRTNIHPDCPIHGFSDTGVSSTDDTIKPTLQNECSPKQDTSSVSTSAWEERFRGKFADWEFPEKSTLSDILSIRQKVESFIRSELQKQRQEIIEKIKKEKIDHLASCEITLQDVESCSCGADQFNKGLDFILDELDTKEEE